MQQTINQSSREAVNTSFLSPLIRLYERIMEHKSSADYEADARATTPRVYTTFGFEK